MVLFTFDSLRFRGPCDTGRLSRCVWEGSCDSQALIPKDSTGCLVYKVDAKWKCGPFSKVIKSSRPWWQSIKPGSGRSLLSAGLCAGHRCVELAAWTKHLAACKSMDHAVLWFWRIPGCLLPRLHLLTCDMHDCQRKQGAQGLAGPDYFCSLAAFIPPLLFLF